jgi:hypothetical protein
MDDKVRKTLSQTMKKPGGGESGCVISTRAEMALYVACYMARHYQCKSRTMTVASTKLPEVESIFKRRRNKECYKEPTSKMKLAMLDLISDFVEELPDHRALFNGQIGGPLSYVTHNS